MRSLSDTLRSFVQYSSGAEITTLQSDFVWPRELSGLAKRFTGYTWGKPLDPDNSHVFGISQLPSRWPTDNLEDLESAIFEPRVKQATFGLIAPGLDHYLFVELLDARAVRANLAMLLDSRDWYLLDEHIISIR